MKKISWKLPKTFDLSLFIIPILLTTIGVVVIYSITYYNNNINLVYNQIISAVIGIVIMIILTFVDYRNYKNIAWILYLLGITLLVLVFFIGKTSFGAKRWIDLVFYDLQPSELMKLFMAITISALLADSVGKVNWRRLVFAFLLCLIPVVLVMKQPDLGSASVIFIIGASIILYSRLNWVQLGSIIMIGIIGIGSSWFFLKDYQKERLYTFMNPSADRFGSGYNVIQSMITVGSGGLTGKGFGHGPQSQLNFLPVAHTDFIFSGFSESVGFIGSVTLIIVFMILIWRIVNVATISKDYFGMLLSIGIATMFLFQIFVNIGMNIGIMPVTGIPLPFVSYGGSAMVPNFAAIGILQSIYLRHKKISFEGK